MYFNVMTASSGGITIDYLEKQPFAKIVWLSRVAEVFLLKKHLDLVYATNAGYAGDQNRLNKIQQRLDFLLLSEVKTDIEKLKQLKMVTGKKRAEARKKSKEKKKRKKYIRLNWEKDKK
jgi:hypothetical protein